MSTLWLDNRNLELRVDGGALVPFVGGLRQRPVPLRLLERVVIVGNCLLDARTLTTLAGNGISVALLSPRKPERRIWLTPPGHGDITLRLAQLRAACDDGFRSSEALTLIKAKVARQHKVVSEMLAMRPDAAHPLNRALRILDGIASELEKAAPLPTDTLRGMEGTASRAGFEALSAVLPASLEFTGRKRRPPPDPVNVILSLSYTILHHRAAQTAWAYGLEPLAGFFHEPVHGRESLASDLIEPWRPEIERWTWRLFADRSLRKEHFTMPSGDNAACMLGKAGRRIYYELLERELAPVHRALRLQVRNLVQRIRRHGGRCDAEDEA